MPSRAPYYQVAKSAWLFTSQLATSAKEQPEEEVRQWCAFELIRAYGCQVSDLTFEHEVKVGSKSYRIDILVKRNGAPWIVVECKQSKHRNHAGGLAQAVSYASAQTVRAEFALYTNGSTWNASRRVGDRWISVVDIPSLHTAEAEGSIDDLLYTLQKTQPILHKLDDRVEGDAARILLSALQVFFHGSNLLTVEVDKDLRFGTDCLLRVLSTGVKDEHYAWDKANAAAVNFEEFRLRTGIGYPLNPPGKGEPIGAYMSHLMSGLAAFVKGPAEGLGIDVQVVRLNIALLHYGRQAAQSETGLPAITPQINGALRGVLTHAFATRLGVNLPTQLDALLTSDMKHFCAPAWAALLEDEKQQVTETSRDLVRALFSSLAFWRWRR